VIGLLILGSQIVDLGTFLIFQSVVPGGSQYEANPLVWRVFEAGGVIGIALLKLGVGTVAAVLGNFAYRNGRRTARVVLMGCVAFTVLASASNALSLAIAVN
jgi:hypothetical protein